LTHAPRIREIPYLNDLLPLHVADPDRLPFLLQSAARGDVGSTHDILFALPCADLTCAADLQVFHDGIAVPGRFLDALDGQLAHHGEALGRVGDRVPFAGGWFLFLGYELLGEIEPGVARLPVPGAPPVARAVRCEGAIISDHQARKSYLSSRSGCLPQIESLYAQCKAEIGPLADCGPLHVSRCQEDDPQCYRDAVERIVEYIHAGDVFQVNISRTWRARIGSDIESWRIYRALRACNPAPFAGLARFESQSIISSSPERLVRCCGKRIETRPIAGTRPRSRVPDMDQRLLRELRANPKECAEHIMLIDLERNDLGRVCSHGSIHVERFMNLESYAHVHHIVSDIYGSLRSDVGIGDVIRAVFPGGTITGCPKVRCMEVIAELEQQGRGAYTGSMGYLGLDGSLDLNILIRTMLLHDGALEFRAGGGIVADSKPQQELDETRAKARGLLQCLKWRDHEDQLVG